MFSLKEFKSPSHVYRGKVFWAWNGELEDEELRRQIRIFHEMGFGGFYMHARKGLKTPYLSKQWFEKIEVCIKEAGVLGMEAWLYDEDNYPSGYAGGLVTSDKKYRQRIMTFEILNELKLTKNEDALESYFFAVQFENEYLLSYRRIHSDAVLNTLPRGIKIVRFDLKETEPSPWYNNATYLDTLNPKAVGKFVEITYEPYAQRFKDFLGSSIVPGIFTDEPNVKSGTHPDGCTAWTEDLPTIFFKKYGYDILDKLPELFIDTPSNEPNLARYHFFVCRNRMFVEAYCKQIGQWCDKNTLKLTGHGVGEWPLSEQALCSGSVMQHYEYMQIPGIDSLLQDKLEYLSPKQLSSVTHQMGKKWAISEMYGGTGWEADFKTYKFIGDWQAVLGVNVRCAHLAWYTMAGEGKRDYPASINHFSPWWKEYRYIEDYFARTNLLLSEGELISELGFIHPIESYYTILNAGDSQYTTNPQALKMDELYDNIVRTLLGNQLDFDFIDEHLLQQIDTAILMNEYGVPVLQIGQARYKAVVVPPLISIRENTVEILSKFVEQGGRVFFIEHYPTHVSSQKYLENQWNSKFFIVPNSPVSIVKALEDIIRNVSVWDKFGNVINDVFCQLRRIEDGYVLFLVNTNRNNSFDDINVIVSRDDFHCAEVVQCQAIDGDLLKIDFTCEDEQLIFKTEIEAGGSRLFLLSNKKNVQKKHQVFGVQTDSKSIELGECAYELDEYNLMVLDRAECLVFSSDTYSKLCTYTEILRLDAELRSYAGMSQRGADMVQPWATLRSKHEKEIEVIVNYPLKISTLPDLPIYLALEQADRWQISVNGVSLEKQAAGYWVDISLTKISLPQKLFHVGDNIISLRGCYEEDACLENMFILGNFGVDLQGDIATMTVLKDKLSIGSIAGQGLPFYGGNIYYNFKLDLAKKDLHKYELSFPKLFATGIVVSVNNKKGKLLGFPEYLEDITDDLHDGKNNISVKLLGSRRNCFGPLHHVATDRIYCGPNKFRPTSENYQSEYNVVDYGLFENPILTEWLEETKVNFLELKIIND